MSNTLRTYGPVKTSAYLAYLHIEVPGELMECMMLPTGELLVLTREDDGYALHLIGASEFIPQMKLEHGLSERERPFTLGYYAAVLLNPGKPTNFVIEPAQNW